jgi:PAS domain S-box-containing protein
MTTDTPFSMVYEQIQAIYKGLEVHSAQLEEENKHLRDENSLLHTAYDTIEDLYHNAPCGYLSVDKDGLILRINQTLLDWLGYTKEEVLNKMNYRNLMSSKEKIGFTFRFEELIKSGGAVFNLQRHLVCRDGRLFPFLVSATSIFDKDGHFKMSRSVFTDYREKQQFEETIVEKNKQLEHLNTEKNRFINIASHDLRNPLQTILLCAETIKIRMAVNKTEDEKQQKCLHHIVEASEKMSHIIQEFLDVEKIG